MNKPIRVGLAKTKTPGRNGGGLAPVKVTQKDGNEPFHEGGKQLAVKLKYFWQWSASDLMSNTSRSLLARYLVANALGLAGGVRDESAPFDLETENGMKIDVQSFSPFQSEIQEHSKLSSGIKPAHSGNEATGKFAEEILSEVDVYVLCVLGNRETVRDRVDPLNLHQWDFYVVKASLLNEESSTHQAGLIPVKYAELGATIRDLELCYSGPSQSESSPSESFSARHRLPGEGFSNTTKSPRTYTSGIENKM
jgi:hypothetical protein